MPGDLAAAEAAIDAVNAADPTLVDHEGRRSPLALVHGTLAVEWLLRLDPAATDAQRVAARAHHLRRWAWPRSDYPEGRAGYLRWRKDAKDRHAEEVAGILTTAGFDAADVERVQSLIRKVGLGTDPQVQVHEDAICLAFLATQLDPVAAQLGDEKAVAVLAKTARKMSAAGLAAAAGLPLSEHGARLLHAALDGAA